MRKWNEKEKCIEIIRDKKKMMKEAMEKEKKHQEE